ncbi:MAG: alpha/beta fold hydrolase [Myxococcota bacterium]
MNTHLNGAQFGLKLLMGLQALMWLSGCGDSDDPSTPSGQVDLEADGGGVDTDSMTMSDTGSTTVDASADTQEPLPTLTVEQFSEPGPYNIGFQRHEADYTPDGQEELRTVRIVIWYPTEAQSGEPAEYADLLPREGVFTDARVALQSPAPVLVFTHGSTAIAEQSWFMAEYFATHGWIVVAMDHPGNTLFDNGNGVGPYVELRPQDVRVALDYIDTIPAAESLSGLFSDDRLIAGHSYGGQTALVVAGASFDISNLDVACEAFDRDSCDLLEDAIPRLSAGYRDDRIKAVISMTPGGYLLFRDGLTDVDIPVLLMTGARDKTLPEEEEGDPFWNAMDGPNATRMVFLNAGHMTFSNLCEVVPGFADDDGCGDSFLPPEEAHIIINAYSMAFARAYVLGDPQAAAWLEEGFLLEGEVEVFEKR